MNSWIKAKWCALRGHEVVKGATCPVTGIQLLTCHNCGKDNMPKHDKGMSFN